MQDVLARLEDRGLVLARLGSTIEGQRAYAFIHILTRDVAYKASLAGSDSRRTPTWPNGSSSGPGSGGGSSPTCWPITTPRPIACPDDVRRGGPEESRYRTEAFRYALLASDQARSKLALSAAERQAELALSLAPTPLDRSRALEALGESLLLDSEGDQAWRCLKESVDIRLEANPADTREIARLCAKALEVPTRTRGSMRVRPPREEASPYLELGMASVGPADSEELARLLIVKACWPASLGEGRGTEQEELDARESGEQAAAMATRLDRPDCARPRSMGSDSSSWIVASTVHGAGWRSGAWNWQIP